MLPITGTHMLVSCVSRKKLQPSTCAATCCKLLLQPMWQHSLHAPPCVVSPATCSVLLPANQSRPPLIAAQAVLYAWSAVGASCAAAAATADVPKHSCMALLLHSGCVLLQATATPWPRLPPAAPPCACICKHAAARTAEPGGYSTAPGSDRCTATLLTGLFMNFLVISRASGGRVAENTPICGQGGGELSAVACWTLSRVNTQLHAATRAGFRGG